MILIWLGSFVGGAGIGMLATALFLGTFPGASLPFAIISIVIAVIAFILSIGLAIESVNEASVIIGTACITGLFLASAVLGFHTANVFDALVGPFAWIGGFVALVGAAFTYVGWKTEY